MKQRLKFHLEFAGDRDIVVWGTGERSVEVVEVLKQFGVEIICFVSKNCEINSEYLGKPVVSKDKLDKKKVYVIEATSFISEISRELRDLGFEVGVDFYNWYEPTLPYDYKYNGILLGKCSYFPIHFSKFLGENAPFNSITSIGRFTSINETAQVNLDHPMSNLSTGIFHSIVGDKYRERMEAIGKRSCDGTYGSLEIGNDVWIGANAFINASKVKSIGDGAIIGAGAVVLEDVPPYAIVVGVPAKVKKYRFTEEQIEILKEVQWWNWSNEEIKENIDMIVEPSKFFLKHKKILKDKL